MLHVRSISFLVKYWWYLNIFEHKSICNIVYPLLLTCFSSFNFRYDIKSPVTWTEVAVGCFVLGHSWEIFTNLLSKKCSTYFRTSWSVFDLVMFSMFLLAEILWFIVYSINIKIPEKSYHTNRMYWKWYHPVLIGEAIYACASVMAFIRLFLWFQVNSRLGPLGTSIRYMVGKFAFVSETFSNLNVSKYLLNLLILDFINVSLVIKLSLTVFPYSEKKNKI